MVKEKSIGNDGPGLLASGRPSAVRGSPAEVPQRGERRRSVGGGSLMKTESPASPRAPSAPVPAAAAASRETTRSACRHARSDVWIGRSKILRGAEWIVASTPDTAAAAAVELVASAIAICERAVLDG